MLRNKKSLIVLLICFIFSVILIYPLIFHLNTKVIGCEQDQWDHMWLLWHMKAEQPFFNFDFFTDLQFYPVGIDILTERAHLLLSYFCTIFLIFFSITFTYNLMLILGITFSCFSVYLLAKYLIKDVQSAIISGLVFGLSPLLLLDITVGSLELVHLEWMVLYILFSFKLFDSPSWKNFLITTVLFILTCLFNWYYGIFAAIFTFIIIINNLIIKNRRVINKRFLLRSLFALILVIIILIPYLMLFFNGFQEAFNISDRLETNITSLPVGELSTYSGFELFFIPERYEDYIMFRNSFIDVISPMFILPLPIQYRDNIQLGLTSFLLTYSTFILFAWGIFIVRKRKQKYFFGISLLLFLILSLGPYVYLPINKGVFIPMPLLLLYRVMPDFLKLMRPLRFFWGSYLCISLLTGFGFWGLKKYFRSIKLTNIFFITILSIVIMEYLTLLSVRYERYPCPVKDTKIPKIYHNLKSIPGDFAIIELPFYLNTNKNCKYLYYQTYHGKKLVNGAAMMGRYKELRKYRQFVLRNKFLFNLLILQEKNSEQFLRNISLINKEGLKFYEKCNSKKHYRSSFEELDRLNIRFIVFHKDIYGKEMVMNTQDDNGFKKGTADGMFIFLNKILGEPIASAENTFIYEIDIKD